MSLSRFLSAMLALTFALASSPAARAADEFPSRPVTLIVGFPPGGPSDVIARAFAKSYAEKLGVPVVIDARFPIEK